MHGPQTLVNCTDCQWVSQCSIMGRFYLIKSQMVITLLERPPFSSHHIATGRQSSHVWPGTLCELLWLWMHFLPLVQSSSDLATLGSFFLPDICHWRKIRKQEKGREGSLGFGFQQQLLTELEVFLIHSFKYHQEYIKCGGRQLLSGVSV